MTNREEVSGVACSNVCVLTCKRINLKTVQNQIKIHPIIFLIELLYYIKCHTTPRNFMQNFSRSAREHDSAYM